MKSRGAGPSATREKCLVFGAGRLPSFRTPMGCGAGKLADVAIVATQDNDHYHCLPPARCGHGYHVLLRSPSRRVSSRCWPSSAWPARWTGRVMVCFVLRFAAFYRKVKEIIDSGALGEVTSIQASEGVMPWHQRTRLCRVTGRSSSKSSPMIMSKCCHDTDVVHWLVGRRCRVSPASFAGVLPPEPRTGRRSSPMHDGCPSADTCPTTPCATPPTCACPGWQWCMTARRATPDEITAWLRTSPWGAVCIAATTTPWTGQCWPSNSRRCDRHVHDDRVRHGAISRFAARAACSGAARLPSRHFGIHLISSLTKVRRYAIRCRPRMGYELHGGGDPVLSKRCMTK